MSQPLGKDLHARFRFIPGLLFFANVGNVVGSTRATIATNILST